MSDDKRVFVSYAHEDEDWVKAIFNETIRTTRGRILPIIDEDLLRPGARFDEELRKACEGAHGAVLLVSQNFLKSEYIREKEWAWIKEAHEGNICWIQVGELCPPENGDGARAEGATIREKLAKLHSDIGPGKGLNLRVPETGARDAEIRRVQLAIARMIDPDGTAIRTKLEEKNLSDVRWLSDGALSCVYTARGPAFGRRFAVKVPHSDDELDPFLESIKQARRLSWIPSFISVFDINDHSLPYYCLTDFVEGDQLSQYVAHRKEAGQQIEFGLVQHILLKLSLALSVAHRRGMPHLNIKPSNIILEEREPYLSPTRRDRGNLHYHRALGSSEVNHEATAYKLPEVDEQEDWKDEQADIYFLGLVGYQLLHGEIPPTVANMREVRRKPKTIPRYEPLKDIAGERPDCPTILARTIMRMVERDPEARFSSFDEVAMALMRCPDKTHALAEQAWRECLGRGEVDGKSFFWHFYQHLYRQASKTRDFFKSKGPNWPTAEQEQLLQDSVIELFRYYDLHKRLGEVPDTLNSLCGRAQRHARMGIEPAHYLAFGDAIIDAAAQFLDVKRKKRAQDKHLQALRRVIDPGIRFMRQAVPGPET